MITTRCHRKAKGRVDSLHVVIVDGVEVGFVTKYNNTKTESHPWKAFAGIGMASEMIDVFYTGGKAAAVACVVKATGQAQVAA